MTNTVTYMTHSVDKDLVKHLFAKFANKYGKLWTSRLGDSGDWNSCLDDWHDELKVFNLAQLKMAVKKALAIYRDYPPTQGQLIELCMAEAGVPQVHDVIRLMVNRDFSHPLVKMVYDQIGSWTLTNGKEAEIKSKAQSAYNLSVAEFQCDPHSCWEKLTSFNTQPKLEAPPKVPSNAERKGFKERMEEFQKLADEGRAKLKDMQVIEFDEKKIKPEGEQYPDYCKYLLSVPEHLVLGLPPRYAYDRQRLLNMQDTARHLKESGYIPPSHREGFEAPKTSDKGKPTKVYKSWVND